MRDNFVDINLVKQLHEKTRAGVMECRRALVDSKGDFNKAVQILREKGVEIAAKKSLREAKEGIIEAYVHLGAKIGVLVEVNCETDFVARNEVFRKLCRDLAMQIAATNPTYIRVEDVPKDIWEKEKQVFKETLSDESIHNFEEAWKTHVSQFKRIHCLLEQAFIRDEKLTVKDYLNSVIAQFRENIRIRRFVRYQLGE